MATEQQRQKVLAINTGRWVPELYVRDPAGVIVGALTPINTSSLENGTLMESITRWRIENAAAFASQFSPTVDRTRAWLRDTVLPADDRVLLVIRHGERLIGHVGFRDLMANTYQGDNLVRGERGGGINFMRHALWAFHAWAMRYFGVRQSWSRILAQNAAAIEFNGSLGTQFFSDLESARADGLITDPSEPPSAGAAEQVDDGMIIGTLCWDDLVRVAPEAVIRDFLVIDTDTARP